MHLTTHKVISVVSGKAASCSNERSRETSLIAGPRMVLCPGSCGPAYENLNPCKGCANDLKFSNRAVPPWNRSLPNIPSMESRKVSCKWPGLEPTPTKLRALAPFARYFTDEIHWLLDRLDQTHHLPKEPENPRFLENKQT